MGTSWHNVNGKIWIFVDAEIQVEIIRDTEQLLSCRFTHLGDGQELVLTVVYANDIEKFGGLPVQFAETEDFRQCIDICQLMDLGFTGSMFTWWNGRSDEACIFKRLDRCLGNQALQNCFPNLEVEHLIKQGSDHSPLLVGRALSKWSRDTYGDIFKQIATLEEVMQVHEQEFEQNPTRLNRERLQRVQANLIRFYAIEEKFWRQKAGMQWFQDGDRNKKFFHAHVNGKRRKLQLQRIQDHTEEQNQQLYEMPDEAEVKRAVFGLNGDSAGGPDGFTGRFFQACWEIIAKDLVTMQSGFVKGRSIVENILLAQEIVHDIRIRKKPANIVIKLDMEKAYDRIPKKDFPFTYLGVPIYYGRRRNIHYKEIIEKIQNRLSSWTGKLLSIEGRTKLIKHVLQSMPIHLLSACDPPSAILAQIHRLFGKFFWSNSVGNSSNHWATWTTLCHPQEEGGMGFRSLQDISKALFAKLWWNMRTKQSLWRTFISNKYLKKFHAVIAPSGSSTYVWKKMIKYRDEMEHEIWWKLQQDFECDPTIILVKETAEVGQWDEQFLRRILPEDLADHIVQHINPPNENGQTDKAFWKLDSRGKFTVGSAFQLLRQRKDPSNLYKQMWIKGLPIKISFFIWRFWKFKLPLDDKLKKWGHQFPSRCYCCQHPEVEDTSHVVLHSPTAQAIWKYFCGPVGINIENLQRYSPKIRVTPVTWRTLDIGWIKVNTDGASRGNPGRSSWAFCVRDERGDVIQAQAREIEDLQSTNTEAEALAILQALSSHVMGESQERLNKIGSLKPALTEGLISLLNIFQTYKSIVGNVQENKVCNSSRHDMDKLKQTRSTGRSDYAKEI
ncbi:uncharacterized protein LOC132620077 [Lycium barbarum]|uniref:uncharacterized protein LOC132620077 n=1 Tax=Lycium barbarum TaxID=112863 RepID=UPI00293F6D30|nr:uncharacterized protein LOC132620077 [Lycium barbarum]